MKKLWLFIFAVFINMLSLAHSNTAERREVKTQNCTAWEDGVLGKTLRRLCMLKAPDIRLITVNGSMLAQLRKSKLLTLYQSHEQRLVYGVPNFGRRRKRQLQLLRLCRETPGSIFVLVDDNSNLAYEIETVQCNDGCYIGSRRLRIGNCVTRKKTIEVLVSDGCNGLKSKIIEVGCNCECMKYLMFM